MAAIVFVLMLALIPLGFVLSEWVPPYSNKTEAQQWADMDRWDRERVEACYEAGGQWVQRCTVTFTEPDVSGWYVQPIYNKWDGWAEWAGMLLVTAGICLVFIGPAYILFESSMKRDEHARIQYRLRIV
jgi:hypothetical protein